MQDWDLLIVGAGPTGLTLAIELARRGINFRIIDKASGPSSLSKALIIQAKTLEIFHSYDIAQEVLKESLILKGIYAHMNKKRVSIDFPSIDSRYPYGVMLPQSQTEAILRKKLAEYGVFVEYAKELHTFKQHKEKVSICLKDNELLNATYLVACDGAHSLVREELHIPFLGRDFEEVFALGDVKFKEPAASYHIEFFMDHGFLILFPLPGGYHRIIAKDIQAKEGELLTRSRLEELLEMNHCPYKIQKDEWISYFYIHSRRASRYRYGNIFLAGDAAHIHSPAGGLGMNTGIQDSFNLGFKIASVIKNELHPFILKTYEEERSLVAKQVLEVTENMTRLMMSASGILLKLRNFLFPQILRFKCVRKKLLNKLSQLSVNYRGSTLSYGKLGGNRINNQEIYIVDGNKVWIYDLLKYPRFQLLVRAKEAEKEFNLALSLKNRIMRQFHGKIEVHLFEGSLSDDLILIRPDQYIAFSSSMDDSSHLLAYLKRIFQENS